MYLLAYSLAASAALLAAAPRAGAQEPTPPRLDAAARTRAIDGVLRRLSEGYVFPEVARKMEAHVRQRAAAKAYDNIGEGPALAEALTADLRSVSHDRHLRVSYSADVLPPEGAEPEKPTAEQWEQIRRGQARENFGLARIEVLPGNVGYLDFRYFTALEFAQDTYAGALAVVAHTDALIIDLRRCGGSMSPDAVPFVCSYLFAEPVHLNDIYWRASDSIRQFWTLPSVPGRRYLDKPVYVLTSRQTFSGAEELAYDLQNLKRATLVGEVTGGGANPGGTRRADDHFAVWVPTGRAINPYTRTNWEGTGVTPDVKAPAPQALAVAQVAALTELAAREKDPERQRLLREAAAEAERAKERFRKVAFSLRGFPDARQVHVTGSFNHWSPDANPLVRTGDVWTGEALAEPGRHGYKFIVDGAWITDPVNPRTARDGTYENSLVTVE